jgi:hypothetical protein
VRPRFAGFAWQRVCVVLGVTLSAAAFASACSGGLPPGAVAVKPFGDCSCGQTSTSDTYAPVTTVQLRMYFPGIRCVGTPGSVVAYALCDGSQWIACDCDVPTGFQPRACGYFGSLESSGSDVDSSGPSDAPGIDGMAK